MVLPLPFRRMIYSNSCYEKMAIKTALEYLPKAILEKWQDQVAIFTMDERHGIRINEELRKNREIIFLSDKIWPLKDSDETDRFYRFFIFTVLHEIAHVDLQHGFEYDPHEEDEASKKAKEWFNAHIKEANFSADGNDQALAPLTCKEIKETKEIVQSRDWTYNSKNSDISGNICIWFKNKELKAILDRFDNKGESVEVQARHLLRELLKYA